MLLYGAIYLCPEVLQWAQEKMLRSICVRALSRSEKRGYWVVDRES
jgi:hypothetical protein